MEPTDSLRRLFDRFDRHRRAIAVNFRRLASWLPVGERATHYLHPYPAKLLPHIPAFFLSNTLLSSPGDVVLDPFCGSGTVLLESIISGRNALGADANPLARLISEAKVSTCSPEALRHTLRQVVERARRRKAGPPPDVVNIDYWFYPHVTEQLCRLRDSINAIEDTELRVFFKVCFSVCVRRVSLADPRLSVPVRLRKDQYPTGHPFRESTNAKLRQLRRQDVLAAFSAVTEANIERVVAFHAIRVNTVSGVVVSSDARKLSTKLEGEQKLPDGSVHLIITSPPYAGAQKYIRASSLSLGWLDLLENKSLRQLEDENIGREHFPSSRVNPKPVSTGIPAADRKLTTISRVNPLRAHIAAAYLLEMKDAFREAARVLKPGGHLVLVAANNRICSHDFHTQAYLQQMLEAWGLVVRLRLVDDIKSRGLMTRRNATASVIAREWVLVLQKPEN